MADAYGKLIFSCSEEVELEREKLVGELNKLNWDSWDNGKWAIEENKIFYEEIND
jgi:hypothetical protein